MSLKKLLFVHDGPVISDGNNNYYGVSYSNKLIDRYTYLGDDVNFIMRLATKNGINGSKYSELSHPAFNFIEIPDFKSVRNLFKKKEAKRIIMEAVNAHDIIIVRIPSAAGTIAFNCAIELNKPVLVECVACVYDALWNYNWKGKILAHYKCLQMKRLLRRASHTIYVTNKFLQSRYPTNGKSIGCSDVVLKEFDEEVLHRRLEKIERIENQPLVLGTVAALNVPYKGQADVIRAIGKLKKEGVKVIYKLVGQGDSSRLEKTIHESNAEDRVEIIGPLQHDQVFDFLDEIDVYIQPSRQEGLPRAMVEALSRGCMTTGANTAGIPELIEDRFVFEAGNTRQMNDIIKGIDKTTLAEQAKRNFSEAKKYQASELNTRRLFFYDEFMEDYNFKG